MQRPRPMDRLICGDVGYGKTELAIRAAFKAIDNGKQVAVLVPTTVLAEQHFRTFSQRLAEYPVRRRVPQPVPHRRRADGASSSGWPQGGVDVIIGTHRLVSADVQFKDLGLVIIDEEQRFGVEHKERLKQLRQTVDVLTMTATPIPRTLHLSLLGIRDISNLETPPPDRLAIETRIVRFDPQLIRHAILRELNREGQIYFVHNRVHNIHEIADRAASRSCRRRGSAIGPRPDEPRTSWSRRCCASCAARPTSWWRRRSSRAAWTSPTPTPSSSTRPTTTAWPTCTSCAAGSAATSTGPTPICCSTADRQVTPTAARRLKAIEEFTELGAGFKIAMRDLEIRGAGNILGTQQSGHIAAVGYELYCQLLENAVRAAEEPAAARRRWR